MQDERMERFAYEKFQWERQKFTLMLAVAVSALALFASLTFFLQKGRLDSDLHAQESAKKYLVQLEESQYEVRRLKAKVTELEMNIEETRSLVLTVRENQRAQETLLRSLSEASR